MVLKESYFTNNIQSTPKKYTGTFAGMRESYTALAYEFASESTNTLLNAKQKFVRNLHESGDNPVLLQEATRSFFEVVKAIISKFLNFINRIFDKFITTLNKLFKSEKFIKKHKATLKNFTLDDEFDINGYIYSFSPDVPLITTNSITRWDKENHGYSFDSDVEMYAGITETDPAKKFILGLQSRYDIIKTNASTDGMDIIRGKVLGRVDSIDASDWNNELFKTYRNGEDTKDEIHVSLTVIDEALDRFLNYQSSINKVKDEKRKIEKEYESLKKSLKNLYSGSGHTEILYDINDISADHEARNYTFDDTQKKKLDSLATEYLNTLTSEIQAIANVHASAFAAKLDAMKECFNADRNILYMALKKVLKHDKLSECGELDDDDDDFPMPPEAEEGYDDVYDAEEDEFVKPKLVVHTTTKCITGGNRNGFGGDDGYNAATNHYGPVTVGDPMSSTISEYDLSEAAYQFSLAEECHRRNLMYNYIEEALCLESGTFNDLRLLNEGVLDSLKGAIKKILEVIGGLFRKFAESMNSVFKSQKDYLIRYKYIFNDKVKYPVKSREITVYDYKTDLINSGFSIPAFSYPDNTFSKFMEGEGDDEFKGAFVNTFYSSSLKYDSSKTVQELVEEALRGEDEVVHDATDMDFNKLYNIVLNSDDTITHINKMSSQVNANSTNLTKILQNVETELAKLKPKEEANANQQPTPTPDNNNDGNDVVQINTGDSQGRTGTGVSNKEKEDKQPKPSSNIRGGNSKVETPKAKDVGESTIYSYLYDKTLNEIQIGKANADGVSSKSTISTSTEPGKQGIATGKESGSTYEKINNGINAKGGDDYEKKMAEYKLLEKAAPKFFTYCGEVCAAKLSVVTTMWKEYYQILKTHVRDYVKEDPKSTEPAK